MFALYWFWVAYGGWLLMKIVAVAIYPYPVSQSEYISTGLIAFIWFLFYVLNIKQERDHRDMLWGFLKDAHDGTDRALAGWHEANKIAKDYEYEVKKLKDKYEPK